MLFNRARGPSTYEPWTRSPSLDPCTIVLYQG
ncbi:hypothetical protein RSAG8_03468, partial [Rhizoctonia solani AG-8 WAC10335]